MSVSGILSSILLPNNFSNVQTTATSSSQSTSPIAQALQQLSTDLQSGNVSAAQKDFATLQQDFQSQATQGGGHHHRHHHVDNDSQNSGNGSGSTVSQVFAQLDRALQAGNLSSAQNAYTTLQQDFQQFAQINSLQTQAPAAPSSSSISVKA
jgi:type VI protein secretion system component VasK